MGYAHKRVESFMRCTSLMWRMILFILSNDLWILYADRQGLH